MQDTMIPLQPDSHEAQNTLAAILEKARKLANDDDQAITFDPQTSVLTVQDHGVFSDGEAQGLHIAGFAEVPSPAHRGTITLFYAVTKEGSYGSFTEAAGLYGLLQYLN